MKKLLISLVMLLLAVQGCAFAADTAGEVNNMNRADFANNRFNELFNGEECPISETDKDFYESVKRFVYGDVAQLGNLSVEQRELISIVVLTANQQPDILKKHINAALNIGIAPEKIKSAIYQTAPYVGIPKAVIAVSTANEVFKKHKIKLPLESDRVVNEDTRFEKGLDAQVKIFGEGMKNAADNYPKSQKHIAKFLAEYCFGDFYTSTVLDLKTRELLTLCMLVSIGDTESQIKGHIQGNLNMGNDKETMTAAITQCLPYIGFPRTLNALKYLDQAVPE